MKFLRSIFLFLNIVPCITYAYNADSLKAVLDTVNDPFKKSVVLERLSEHYRYDGQFDISYDYLEQMKKVCETHNLRTQLGEYYNFYAINKNIEGKLDESAENFLKALEIYVELNDSASMANIYENIGITYKDNGQYQKAIESQLKSLEIRERNGWTERIPSIYCNIGVIYERLEQPEKMKEYMYKARDAAEISDSIEPVQMVTIYNELGNVCDNNVDLDSSLYYYNKGLELSKEIGWKRGVSTILGNIADIYYDLGDYEKALNMHLESLELEKEAENVYGVAKEYQFISRVYRDMGNLDLSEEYGLKAYDLAKDVDMLNEIANACEILSDVYEKRKEYKKAFRYQKEYKELSDSIYSVDHKNYIVDLETKYQTTVKQQKIHLLTKENELHVRSVRINRIVIASISVVAVLLMILFVFILRARRKRNALQKADMEQKLLRNQMNPHFIFNALGAIQNYMYNNKTKEAGRFLGEFSTLTRSILKHTREDAISLDEEIASLKSYLSLEQLRLKNSFEYKLSYDENLETEFIYIPPMLIQPFVENAIKHGVEGEKSMGEVVVKIDDKSNFIRFIITDNGRGIKQSVTSKMKGHKSYAMKIFEERIKIMKKQFGKTISFAVIDLSDKGSKGTEVRIDVPVLEELEND